MARPSDWSPVDLDSDPAPGNPEQVRELAEDLQEFADDVGEALGQIRGMASDRAVMDWAGLSADAFRSEFEGVPDNLTKLRDSYDMAAEALARYWPRLETAQGTADRALADAVSAQADLRAAQSALGDAEDWVGRAGEEAERLEEEGEAPEPPDEQAVRDAVRDHEAAQAAASAAQGRVAAAEERLSAARELARQAQELREDAARECARDLEAASDAGIQNRSWWEDAVHWVTENWDTIVDVCKMIVAVLGIVVMIIGGPLAWVVLAAALVVLADTLVKYANGQASLWDVAFAALDCIPGMKGLTTLGGLAAGLRGLATTGLRGLRQGVRGLGQALRNLGRQGDNLVTRTDPIDMATGEMVMTTTDVELAGVLPLVIRRHYRTTLRQGTWFGPSWASTLDQRLVLDEAGLQFVTADGMVLDYPRPQADVAVLPVEGPRWGLAWDGRPGSPMTVHQRDTGQILHFARVPGRRGGELPLTAIADRHGNTLRVVYDETTGAPTELVHDGGYRLGIVTGAGRITELRLLSDPERPTLVRYAYDEAGNLSEVYNSSGLPLTLHYDEKRRITRWQDRNDTWYRYTYDDEGRCVATDGSGGFLASRIVYDTETRRTLFTDALGHTTVYTFNDACQLVTETDPLGHHTHRTWDRYDRLRTVTDALGRTTAFDYDERGELTVIQRPDGHRTVIERNDEGLPVTVTEPDGATWRHRYDAAGNRLAVTDPTGATTRYAYDAHGAVREITDALGGTVHAENDGAGLPVAVTDAGGAVLRYERDAFGRPRAIRQPAGGTTTMTWSVEGRPLRHVDPDGGAQSWRYDAEGNCVAHTNAAGVTVHFEYGPFDVPSARTGADGIRYTFERDAELKLTRVTTAAGLDWTYSYDPTGRLVAETDFDGRALAYSYDATGQLAARTNGLGQTIAFTRDELGRITGKDADGTLTRFTYDPAGRLRHAAGAGVELTLDRDAAGRVLTETVNGRALSRTYDALGRPLTRTTPGGHHTAWDYDRAGRVSRLISAGRVVDFTRDSAGRETHRRIGSALDLSHTWDSAGRLSEQSLAAGGRALRRRRYTYRADHHLTAIHESTGVLGGVGGAEDVTRFSLDAAGRVTAVQAPDWTESYAYDAAGEQTAAHWPDAAGAPDERGPRAYQGSRVTRAGATRYAYDAGGRVVLRQKKRLSHKPDTWRYAWDAEDRLTGVVTPDGTRWRYLYDPLGRRAAKQRLAGDGQVLEQTDFTWSDTQLAEQVTSAPGRPGAATVSWDYQGTTPLTQTEQTRTGPDGGEPAQEEVDARFFAIVTDLVGTPTELVDESGEIAWGTRNTLWGAAVPAPGSAPGTPLRFPGQYADEETGWHYNYHRHYDPGTGRYASPDPLGLGPAPGHYRYVDNPHAWTDPLGLSPCSPGNAALMGGDSVPSPQSFTWGGSNVRYSDTATAIGDDANTIQNFLRSTGAAGHDVIVHGDEMGNFRVDGMITHPQQIADIVLQNPHYNGGPIQIVTCHAATGQAAELQAILNVNVSGASVHMIDLDPRTGLIREWPDGPQGAPVTQ